MSSKCEEKKLCGFKDIQSLVRLVWVKFLIHPEFTRDNPVILSVSLNGCEILLEIVFVYLMDGINNQSVLK